MDFQKLFADLGQSAAILIPVLAIIVGLFIAWIVARLGAFIVRKALERIQVDERASESLETKAQITKWVSGFTFWALFIFVLIGMINLAQGFIPGLQGNVVQSPLQALLAEWVGKIISVGISLLVAWIIATVLKFLVVRILNITKLDERLGESVPGETAPRKDMNESIGKTVFWLVFLVFIPSILNNLGIGQAAESVQGLVDGIISYIPGILGAVIVLVLGGLLARILRQIVTGFLEGVGVDNLGERFGFSKAQDAQPLSALLGTVVYVLVFIPIVVQALDLLALPVISEIGTQLLGSVTSAIISVLGAVVILFVAYYLAKFISEIVTNLLDGIGVDRLPEALGFKTAQGANLSSVVGYVVLVAVMLFAVQGTAESIGLSSISSVIGSLIVLGGNVLLGIVIFMVGIYLANLASNVITTAGGEGTAFLANIIRWAILIFVAGIALTQAGVTLAGNVIQIILFAVGAAVALAFGLGGRDVAARQLESWFTSMPKAEATEETADSE
ncbi:MAG: mechanosensitive ion channel [Anaerolineales bacterium]|nr:mechanosensitive ion channel [Anaerolineales bacterium]